MRRVTGPFFGRVIGLELPAGVSAHEKKVCATPTCKKGPVVGLDGTSAQKKWCNACYERARSRMGLPPNKVKAKKRIAKRARIEAAKRLK